jgi:hypothetical protein
MPLKKANITKENVDETVVPKPKRTTKKTEPVEENSCS